MQRPLSGLLGLSGAAICFADLVDSRFPNTISDILIILLLSALFSVAVYYGLFRFALPLLAPLSFRSKMGCLCASLAAGLILVVIIPVHNPALLKNHQLRVFTTGQRNPEAKGNQITVAELIRIHKDGSMEHLYRHSDKVNLEKHPESPATTQKPTIFTWNGKIRGSAKLMLGLLRDPTAGIAKVVWNGDEETLDLYAPSKNSGIIYLDLFAPIEASLFSRLLFACHVAILGLLVFITSVWLTTRTFLSRRSGKLTRWSCLAYALPCAMVYSLYLYALWPGIMTFDSGVQWNQVVNFRFSNANPFFHTLNIWLMTRIWNSPAVLAIAQVLGISLLIGWGGTLVRRLGAPKIVTWVACLLVAFSPYNGFLTVTLWKDIFYGLSFFALSLIVVKIVFSEGEALDGLATPILLGLLAALVALYRHNGPPAAFGTLILLLFAYPRHWQKMLLSLIIALTLWLVVLGPLASLLSVQREKEKITSNRILHKISGHIHAGTKLTDEERQFLSQIPYFITASRSLVYTCSSSLPIKYYIRGKTGTLPKDFPASKQTKKLLRIYLSLTLRNPLVTIRSHLCASSWMWRIFGNYKHHNYWGPVALHKQVEERLYEQARAIDGSLQSRLRYFFFTLKEKLYGNDLLRSVFLNGTLYLYLLIFSVLICTLRRRSWRILLILAPVVLHTTTLFFLVSHTGFRYQWPVHLVGLLLFLPLLFLPHDSSSGAMLFTAQPEKDSPD